ncbi:MAG: caspase family protein [Lentisphaerota bacterium]
MNYFRKVLTKYSLNFLFLGMIALLLSGCHNLPTFPESIYPTDEELLEKKIFVYRIEPESKGGEAYKVVYLVDASVDVVWKKKIDYNNPIQSSKVINYQLVYNSDKYTITRETYSDSPEYNFTWKNTFSPDKKRIDFVLMNPIEVGQNFNYGYIKFEPVGIGDKTRVTQIGYFDFTYASYWINNMDKDGMTDFVTEMAKTDREKILPASPTHKITNYSNALNNNKIKPVVQAVATSEFKAVSFDGAIDFGKYHAIIIGIDQYRDLPALRTAVSDAQSIAEMLNKDYGFKVNLVLNPTRSQILDELARARQTLTENDNLLIYYAGHGWLDNGADQGYWMPADASRNSKANWISNTDVTSEILGMSSKHVMVVADSCYSGKLTRGFQIKELTPDYMTRMARKKARVVLSSGGLEPVADNGGKGKHSVFATAFMGALLENNGALDGTSLFTKIRHPVMVNSDQTPEYSDIHKAGHDGGDFIFVRKTAAAK